MRQHRHLTVNDWGVTMKRQTSSKGFAILSAASVISKVLAFIYLPVQSMLVHDSGNGVISAGFKLYVLIYALTNAGLPLIISKFISAQVGLGDYKGARVILRSSFFITLALGTVSALFTFFASGFLADWCGMSEAKVMFMCIAPTFLFSSLSCVMHGYFQGHHNMIPTALAQIVEQVFNATLTVLFEIILFHYAVRTHANVVSYTAAGSAIATVLAVAGSATFLSILFFLDRRRQGTREASLQTYHGPAIKASNTLLQMLKFIVPALITVVASAAIDIIDTRSCIPMLLSGGYTKWQAYSLFGIYSTKYQRLLTLPILFATPLITAIIPALSAAYSTKDDPSLTRKIREAFRMNFIVVLPITAAIAFLAQPMITLIFMSQNSGAILVSIGIWTALLSTVQIVQTGVLISLNAPRVPAFSLLIGMIAKVACNYLLIPIHGINIYGAIIGNTLAWIISISINHVYMKKQLNARFHMLHHLLKPGAAAILMGILSFGFFHVTDFLLTALSLQALLANNIAMLLTIPFGCVLYYIITARTGTITRSDIQKMPKSHVILAISRKIPFLVFRSDSRSDR